MPVNEITTADLRKFGRSLAGLLVIFFGLLLPLLLNYPLPWWPYLVALPIWLLAEIAPARLRRLHQFWFVLGETLGRVTTPIVMGVVFYLLVTPIGVIKRSLGLSKLDLTQDPGLTTYRSPPPVRSDMSDPF